jgi:hypothetical protein
MFALRRLSNAWICLLALLLLAAPETAAAQSSAQRLLKIPFAPATTDGYAQGSIDVQYAFLACYGELHVALRLVPGSTRANGVYRMGGKTYTAEGTPQVSAARIQARAARAGEFIGEFPALVGDAPGLGCFSGDLKQLGVLTKWLGPQPKPEQVVNFLSSLSLTAQASDSLRDTSLEARLRGEDRQRQAAAEAQRKAAEQAAEQKRLADAKREADAKRPVSPTPTGAGGGYADATPPPPPLSDVQRVAKAIESDRLLAQQRVAQQQQQYNQFQNRMAANEAESLRQAQAVMAAAPALAELGAGLEDLINGPYYRAKERQYQAAQQKLAGKCFLSHGGASPKDGFVRFGVPISARLSKENCGSRSTSRFKAYFMDVPVPGLVTITLTSGPLMHQAKYNLEIHDKNGHMVGKFYGDEYGLMQKTFTQSFQLSPGEHVIEVSNYFEFDFHPFTLRVDFTDARGRKVVAQPPPPAGTGEPSYPVNAKAVRPSGASLSTAAQPAGSGPRQRAAGPTPASNATSFPVAQSSMAGPYIGLAVAPGPRAVITDVAEGSPAELAGLQVGDEIVVITGTDSGFFGAVRKIRNQAELQQWLATQKHNAKQSLSILRGPQILNVVVTPG